MDDNSGPPLPELREALLSAEEVTMLVADLLAHAIVTGVQAKGPPRTLTAASSLTMEGAMEGLLSRAIPAIQVRYRFDGHEWTDSLFATQSGFRLVRCRHPVIDESGPRSHRPIS